MSHRHSGQMHTKGACKGERVQQQKLLLYFYLLSTIEGYKVSCVS